MEPVRQALLISASFLIIFLWQTFASEYTVQAIGFLVFIYLLVQARGRKKKEFMVSGIYSVYILNTILFFLIFSTGGFDSSLFFILYFLLFGIAFILEPYLAFVFVLGTLIVFLPELHEKELTEVILRFGSLLLLSPIAYFFGKQYRKVEEDQETLNAIKEREKDAANTISQDVEEVLKKETDLKSENVEKLNEILEEADDLREESKK